MIDEKIVRSKGFTQHQLRRCIAGFTLIELILVISVLAILSVVGIAAFSSYSRAQTLNAAAGGLSVTLNLAKSRAYSQVKPTSCGNNTLEGYEVRICGGIPSCIPPATDVDYQLIVSCGVTSVRITSVAIPNITVSANPLFSSVFFPVLKGGIRGGKAMSFGINNLFNESRTVAVDSSGNIK